MDETITVAIKGGDTVENTLLLLLDNQRVMIAKLIALDISLRDLRRDVDLIRVKKERK